MSDASELQEGIDFNLRGLSIFNALKRIVWSCVIDRDENGQCNKNSEVNVPLLKGLLDEIRFEVYMEDQEMKDDHKFYNSFDIKKISGYTNF